MQAIMYAEQPMIVLDYPAVLQAVNTAKWDGWKPYVGGSVWDNMINRASYLSLEPKAVAATGGGSASASIWIAVAAVAVVAAGAVVLIVRRGRRRAIEE
jgi:hypothetical protein